MLGLAVTAMYGQARELDPAERQALSPLCQAVFSETQGRNAATKPFANLLRGTCGVHHTCDAELWMIRYERLRHSSAKNAERNRRGILQEAENNLSYEIRCAPPTYPLLPKIHTDRARVRMLLGRQADAMKDVQRAAELRRAYPQGAETSAVVAPGSSPKAVPVPAPAGPAAPAVTEKTPPAPAGQQAGATPAMTEQPSRDDGAGVHGSRSAVSGSGRTVMGN